MPTLRSARYLTLDIAARRKGQAVAALIGAFGLLSTATAIAQNGGDYDITKGAIAGGGGTGTGGDYRLSGTIGQHDADEPLMGGDYELFGGFWAAGVDPTLSPPNIGDDTCAGGTNDGASCSVHADCPGGACGLKNRYLSITPPPVASRGVPITDLSIQVTLVDIDDALGQDGVEGQVWWAGPSQPLPNLPHADLTGAPLTCEASPSHAEQWPTGVLHLFGAPIVPGSTYEVRMCDASGTNCSDPLIASTGKWGDVVPVFGGGSQPNFADITALVDKFKELASAPDVSRTDLVPEVPNHVTNFADINAAVNGFKGSLYPYIIPACP